MGGRSGAVVLLVALLAGCTTAADAGRQWPAAAAGPACQLVEYDVVEARIGIRFDTAGGARKGETVTCALTQAGHDYPDLTLAVSVTAADELIFRATLAPSGSTPVKGLGRIGYRVLIAGAAKRGPGLEIGWLTTDGRLLILRYTSAVSTTPAQIDEMGQRLLALAQQINNPHAR